MAKSLPSDAVGLVQAIRAARTRKQRAAAERALRSVPDVAAVSALIAAVRAERNHNTYKILGRLLAERGGDLAATELARQARQNSRFPGLAVRALARCDHPARLATLVDLADSGRQKKWQVAIDALGKIDRVEVIEPLCRVVTESSIGDKQRFARGALHRMGRPDALAMRALADPALTELECANVILALDALPVYVFPLSFTQFNGERFLLRAASQDNGSGARAESVLQRVQDQRRLLRASGASTGDQLLRSSVAANGAEPDELLRASDRPPAEQVAQRRWIQWVRERLRRGRQSLR